MKITSQADYNKVKDQVEALINEATVKGMLEPEMDNSYTRKIAELSRDMADYEDIDGVCFSV